MLSERQLKPTNLTGEPVYFGVVKRFGRLEPQRYHGIVSPSLMGKNSPLIYCTRIDNLPNGPELVEQPLWKLMATYLQLERAGKLPPQDRGQRAQ